VSNFTVVYDACVLYPAPLRDLLMQVAVTDLYRAKWTDVIHDEWTRNVLRDRPDLKPYGIEAQHPDDFLTFQLELAPNVVCAAAKRHRASLKNPPKDVDEYLATLEAQGLAQTVSSLRRFAELI
jgi:hypothetical protein